jgi:hypothetical protein
MYVRPIGESRRVFDPAVESALQLGERWSRCSCGADSSASPKPGPEATPGSGSIPAFVRESMVRLSCRGWCCAKKHWDMTANHRSIRPPSGLSVATTARDIEPLAATRRAKAQKNAAILQSLFRRFSADLIPLQDVFADRSDQYAGGGRRQLDVVLPWPVDMWLHEDERARADVEAWTREHHGDRETTGTSGIRRAPALTAPGG